MHEQGSDEWHIARAGKITASRFSDAIAINKKSPGKSTEARNTYMRTVVAEILSGQPVHEISSKSLSWGTKAEPLARSAYEILTGQSVSGVGFIPHPDFDFIGSSPDGFVADDGGIEIKCPYSEQGQIMAWIDGMPEEHMPQVQGGMLVTGRAWCDFLSYDPRQAEPYQLYVQRILRDQDYISVTLLPGLLQFWREVQHMIETINKRAGVFK